MKFKFKLFAAVYALLTVGPSLWAAGLGDGPYTAMRYPSYFSPAATNILVGYTNSVVWVSTAKGNLVTIEFSYEGSTVACDTAPSLVVWQAFTASTKESVRVATIVPEVPTQSLQTFTTNLSLGSPWIALQLESPKENATSLSNVTVKVYNTPGSSVATYVTGTLTNSISGTAAKVAVLDTADTSAYPALFTDPTGNLAAKTDAGLTYNAATANLTASIFTGALVGNADTATAAATSVVIDTTDTSAFIAMFDDATGSRAIKTDLGLTYNAATANLSATTFTGALTGNASTATRLATGVHFTGSVTNIDGGGTNVMQFSVGALTNVFRY